jgi:ketol-acid reductoisomerase
VHFKFVKPPKHADVILLAPHAPGVAVREQYLGKRDISAFYAVHQNHSKRALQTVFALANGIGIEKKRLVKTTFTTEAIGDLFGEQAVLCGGLAALIKNGFDVLVESGIPPENAYLEVAYQLDLIIKLIKQYGIEGMFARISVAARYGSLLTGPKLIDTSVKRRMKVALSDITSGRFPKELNSLSDADVTRITKALASLSSPKLEKAARKFAPK